MAVGGAHPHIDACGGPLVDQVMGPASAGMNIQRQHLRLPPGKGLDLRNEPRADPIADEVGEPLLLIQRVGHAAHIAVAILLPDQQDAAGRVGEDHDRFSTPHPARRDHA